MKKSNQMLVDLPININNSVDDTSSISLEWKHGTIASTSAKKIELNGQSILHVSTQGQEGWVRLHLALSKNFDKVSVLGSRIVLMVEPGAVNPSIKPHIVESNLSSDSRNTYPKAPAHSRKIKPGQWYEVHGAFAVGKAKTNRRTDIVLDLPLNAQILIADVTCDWFDAKIAVDKEESINEIVVDPIANFEIRSTSDLVGTLEESPIYFHDFRLEDGGLSGRAITRSETIYLSRDASKDVSPISISKPGQFNGVEIEGAGIEFKIAENFSKVSAVSLRSSPEGRQPFWTGSIGSRTTSEAPKKSLSPRDRQDQIILLWAPISTAGLTVQLEQVTELLEKNKFPYKISYHMQPRVDHPLRKHWIEPRDIDSPKMVIYFERFVQFDRGFEGAFKVFYMNLDWLSDKTLSLAKVHAKAVLCPTPYRMEELSETFQNSQVLHLPWPANFEPRDSEIKTDPKEPIRVLYVGNDYDDHSRKHPYEVVEAIQRLTRTDIVFDLKFRSALPQDVKDSLNQNSQVNTVIDWSTDYDAMKELYTTADINLIPNACEGNGLSILEAWASGTVPAVLDGHPMKDVTSAENSFRISCEETGKQEYAPYHKTTADDILAFLDRLTWDEVREKKEVVRGMAPELVDRKKRLEEALCSYALLSGIRTKGLRMRVAQAHLPRGHEKDNWKLRFGKRVSDLMLSEEGQSTLLRKPKLIDVMLTTSQRPWCLRDSLAQLIQAMRMSPYDHRLFVAIDTLDPGTLSIINQYSAEIDQVLWTKERHGLPYTWNSLNDLQRNTVNRSELKPDYICYIQDDCFIKEPASYFARMVGLASECMPGYLGFVSGYYTEVHPGFADFEWKGNRVIASDSIDGKNFMGTPEVMASVGPLSWWFSDGLRRGNPGPVRGSHFDLWQWKESPNSLSTQYRISLVLPDLCSHTAARASDSTWNNDTTDEAVQSRIELEKVYHTRGQDAKSD